MVALIDGDSIIYIAAWHNREDPTNAGLLRSVDNIINDMLVLTGVDGYYGILSSPTCFRAEIYKYAAYKGNRKPKEPWLADREPLIKQHLMECWGFFRVRNLEADDVVCWMAETLITRESPVEYVICSPDKDLNQIPYKHYNYNKAGNGITSITSEEADKCFWIQVLMGDDTDNICGVPKLGPKKAEALLNGVHPFEYRSIVKSAYNKYFGEYYGGIIFEETYQVVRLLNSRHPQEARFYADLQQCLFTYFRSYTPVIKAPDSIADALHALFMG